MRGWLLGALLLLASPASAQVATVTTDATTFDVGSVHTVEFYWQFPCQIQSLSELMAVWSPTGQRVILTIPKTCAPATSGQVDGIFWQAQTCLVGPIPANAHGKTLGLSANGTDRCGHAAMAPSVYVWMW